MRVLIVDDELTTAELTADCLMMDPDLSVQIACDGASALRLVTEFGPEAIFLDVELPDACGLFLAPQLKAVCPNHAPRIIIFSGSIPETDGGALPPGVDAWITKPVHLDALLECIRFPSGARTS